MRKKIADRGYCIVSNLRARLMFFVTLRCCLAEKPVYLRGKILPVSVIKRDISCGLVKGISSGLGVWVVGVSVLLLIGKETEVAGGHVRLNGPFLSLPIRLGGYVSNAG